MLKKITLSSCLIISFLFSGCSNSKENVAELYLEALKTNNPDLVKGHSTLLTYVQLTEYIASICLNNIEKFDKNVIKSQILLRIEQDNIPTNTNDIVINNKIIEICKNENYFNNAVKIKKYNFVSSEEIGEKSEIKYEVLLNNGEKYIKSIIMKKNNKTGEYEIE